MVGVVVDGVSAYGRGVLRGVLRHANLDRQWILHEDLWRASETLDAFPKCDGAIVAGFLGPHFDKVCSHARHVVHCSSGGDPSKTIVVSIDDHAVGRIAAEHLLDCRLEHFAYYGETEASVSASRLQGFRQALEQRGYTCVPSGIGWPVGTEWFNHTHWPRLIDWLHSLPKPVGVLAADDSLAHDLARVCLEADIAVPDRVSILGVNNDDLLCEAAWPTLSSVEVDYSRVGYLAAKLLDQLMSGQKLPKQERCVRLPPIGVCRRVSTDVLAVNEPHLNDAIRYIREHACDPCNVRDILQNVPVARRWLERQFVARIGRTPHAEITHVRMETAKRMLMQPDLTIPAIAERCGYSAVQNFTRVFRQVVGKTPATYRRARIEGGRSLDN